MTFKEKGWVVYGRKAKYMSIGIKDNFKQTIESFELEKGKDIDNKRKLKKIGKYGFDLEITEKKKEGEWLKKDMEW